MEGKLEELELGGKVDLDGGLEQTKMKMGRPLAYV